ncbi:MAG: DUF2341 domain-containing protein [Candidatus Firestonebacteria bacterium]
MNKLVIGTIIAFAVGAYAVQRQEVVITNSSVNTLSNYQVLINLTNGNSDFWSSVKNDGGDIRFRYKGEAPVPYWTEKFNYAGQQASIWVKSNCITASSSLTIYMDYGDSSLSTLSDLNNVMEAGLRYSYYGGILYPPSSNTYLGTGVDANFTHTSAVSSLIKINPNDDAFALSSNISVTWEGWILSPNSGTQVVTLYAKTDDAVRLSVPETAATPNINVSWVDRAETENTCTVTITNINTVKYEFYHSLAAASSSVKFGWSPVGGSGLVYPVPSDYLRCRKRNYESPTGFVEPSVSLGSLYAVRNLKGFVVTPEGTGVRNISVSLYNAANTYSASTITDITGGYLFDLPFYGLCTLSYSGSEYKMGQQAQDFDFKATNTLLPNITAYKLNTADAPVLLGRIFTPNSTDSRYNTAKFFVHNNNGEQIKLSVYRSSGTLVRELVSVSKTDIQWDGTDSSGKLAAGGLYFYQLSLSGNVIKKGTFTLIK